MSQNSPYQNFKFGFRVTLDLPLKDARSQQLHGIHGIIRGVNYDETEPENSTAYVELENRMSCNVLFRFLTPREP